MSTFCTDTKASKISHFIDWEGGGSETESTESYVITTSTQNIYKEDIDINYTSGTYLKQIYYTEYYTKKCIYVLKFTSSTYL